MITDTLMLMTVIRLRETALAHSLCVLLGQFTCFHRIAKITINPLFDWYGVVNSQAII